MRSAEEIVDSDQKKTDFQSNLVYHEFDFAALLFMNAG